MSIFDFMTNKKTTVVENTTYNTISDYSNYSDGYVDLEDLQNYQSNNNDNDNHYNSCIVEGAEEFFKKDSYGYPIFDNEISNIDCNYIDTLNDCDYSCNNEEEDFSYLLLDL